MLLVDSHCHLDALNYNSLHSSIDDVIAKAAAQNVKHILTIGTNLERSETLIELVGNRPEISISCGVHPLELEQEPDYIKLRSLAQLSSVVALGETGLDYYYRHDNHLLQQESFRQHIRIACDVGKPVIVHTRSAQEETLAILNEENARECGGVLHCFTEDCQMAVRLMDIGFYISFSGMITFKNANALREVAHFVPLENMLIETDSPYLAPVPFRGKENQPAYIRNIAEYLAILKGVSVEELAKITTANFNCLFRLNV